MKIYPSKHIIYNTDEVDVNEDIVIGYLDSDFMKETVTINISDEYKHTQRKEVLPYDIIKNLDIAVYNKNDIVISDEKISKILVKQTNNTYMYIPDSQSVFSPVTFNYSVLAKKNMEYISNRKYNIKVNCKNKELSEKLIHFFSDSYDRGLCPTNIRFNGGNREISSILNNSNTHNDFEFIIDDGKEIKIEDYMNKNTIPWIICDKLPEHEYAHNPGQEYEFAIKDSKIINTVSMTTNKVLYVPPLKEDERLINFFIYSDWYYYPIIIKEKINKGIVIYSTHDFIERLGDLYTIFYEIIVRIYLESYMSTQKIQEWITDYIPDYIVQNGKLNQKEKFTSYMELHRMLGIREGEAYPVEVKIESNVDDGVIYYTGLSSNYLIFKKKLNTRFADPIKSPNQISIFTSRKNVLYYDDFIYTINEDIEGKISHSIDGAILKVYVKPFKNSYLNTKNFTTTKTAEYELNQTINTQNLAIIWDMKTKDIKIISSSDDNENPVLATIHVSRSKAENKMLDMRKRGGGLSESSEDNFSCLDIGHVLGRPYRKGGSMIVTINLSEKHKDNESVIYERAYEAIKKNMVADDYLILKINYI